MYEKRYVITKTSRMNSAHSYSGPTWDFLPMGPEPFYTDKAEAEQLAAALSVWNPVGFVVLEMTE